MNKLSDHVASLVAEDLFTLLRDLEIFELLTTLTPEDVCKVCSFLGHRIVQESIDFSGMTDRDDSATSLAAERARGGHTW